VERGRIRPAAFYAGRVKAKRRRAFDEHARGWRHGMRGERPGRMVQVDQMSVSFPGAVVKNCTAMCPATG